MKKKIVVLGAGISGLTTAWLLRKKYRNSIEITILEKSPSTGGMIQSKTTDNFIFETGPNAFITRGKGIKTLSLIRELGLSDQLIPSSSSSQNRYLYYKNKIRKFGLPLLLQTGLIPSLLKDLFGTKIKRKDETLRDFLSNHFSDKFIDNILCPFITATKAGDIHTLSSLSTFPLIKNWANLYGSLIWGCLCNIRRMKKKESSDLPYLFSLQKGMSSLVHRLTLEMHDCLNVNFSITQLSQHPNGKLIIKSPEKEIQADFIFSCIHLNELKAIFANDFLNHLVRHTSDFYLTSVAAGWKTPPPFKKQGYGMLVGNDPNILGFLWNSDIFPKKFPGKRQISILMSGQRSSHEAFRGLAHYLNINKVPDEFAVSDSQWGIPQRKNGFNDLFLQASDYLPKNLILSGQGISGPGVNSCIDKSYEIVENFVPN